MTLPRLAGPQRRLLLRHLPRHLLLPLLRQALPHRRRHHLLPPPRRLRLARPSLLPVRLVEEPLVGLLRYRWAQVAVAVLRVLRGGGSDRLYRAADDVASMELLKKVRLPRPKVLLLVLRPQVAQGTQPLSVCSSFHSFSSSTTGAWLQVSTM